MNKAWQKAVTYGWGILLLGASFGVIGSSVTQPVGLPFGNPTVIIPSAVGRYSPLFDTCNAVVIGTPLGVEICRYMQITTSGSGTIGGHVIGALGEVVNNIGTTVPLIVGVEGQTQNSGNLSNVFNVVAHQLTNFGTIGLNVMFEPVGIDMVDGGTYGTTVDYDCPNYGATSGGTTVSSRVCLQNLDPLKTISTAGIFTDSASGAASIPAVNISGSVFTGGSSSTTQPLILIQPVGTSNATGYATTGTILGINQVSSGTADFFDFFINNIQKSFMTKDGNIGVNAVVNAAFTDAVGMQSNGINISNSTNDANAAVTMNKSNASATGDIADFQAAGSTVSKIKFSGAFVAPAGTPCTAMGVQVGTNALTGLVAPNANQVAVCANGTQAGSFTSGGLNVSGVLQSNSVTINTVLTGTTGSIGGGALIAGACTSGTVAVTSSTTAMSVIATPVTYPGDGTDWKGYVSSAGTVTVKVCALVAVTPTATTYNVRVIQ